jgi:hypothetical protein
MTSRGACKAKPGYRNCWGRGGIRGLLYTGLGYSWRTPCLMCAADAIYRFILQHA